MTRSPVPWLIPLWIGVLIHLDWHLGRPGHGHLSFGLSYHWLLGVGAFAPLPWVVLRRWPSAFLQASVLVILLGVALGQGFEPLGEVVHFRLGWDPFTNPVRWRVFAEFMGVGILTYFASADCAFRRRRGRGILEVRDQLIFGWIGAVFIGFLCGCAASTQSSAAAEKPEPDCSFRSPTTCWTVSGRFPSVRSKPTAPPLERTPRQASAVLARGADSASSSR